MLEYLFGSLSFGGFLKLCFYLFVVLAVIGLLRASMKNINAVLSNWHEYMEQQPFSAQEFYASLREDITAKAIPQLVISKVLYPQGGIFSMSREYLRVQCKDYVFDVCAAPFGTGFFVSYWMGELPNPLKDMFKNMPWFGRLFRNRVKTFFELDNEMLFKEVVSTSVKKVLAELREHKGIRSVETERTVPVS